MKNFIRTLSICAGLSLASIVAPLNFATAQNNSSVQFACVPVKIVDPSGENILPTTAARVAGREEVVVLIVWKSEYFVNHNNNSGYTPQRRCEIVSPKFQEAFNTGRTFLTSGVDRQSGQGIICAVAAQQEQCDRSKMLFTLKSYQDAKYTIEHLVGLSRGTVNVPIYQSSGNPVVNLRDLANLR
jgi:hypothetical protein